MLNQNSSCTSSGVDRNIHTKPQLSVASTGLSDNRITASGMPSRKPSTITTPVSHRVRSSPSSTAAPVKYWPTTSHWKARLRTTELTTIAKSSSATAADSRRPTRRRGTIRGRSSSGPRPGIRPEDAVGAPADAAGAESVRSGGEAIGRISREGGAAWVRNRSPARASSRSPRPSTRCARSYGSDTLRCQPRI